MGVSYHRPRNICIPGETLPKDALGTPDQRDLIEKAAAMFRDGRGCFDDDRYERVLLANARKAVGLDEMPPRRP